VPCHQTGTACSQAQGFLCCNGCFNFQCQ
jgi:hypothetical protein